MSNKINKSKLLFRLLLLIGVLSILICLSMCILLDINRNIKFPLQYKLFQILIHNSYNDPIYEIVHIFMIQFFLNGPFNDTFF